MFNSRNWAAAFVSTLSAQGADAQDGLRVFSALAAWAESLPGAVFGSSASEKLEKLIRGAVGETIGSRELAGSSPAIETATRFIVLLIRKNRLRHAGSIIDEAGKILDRESRIVKVLLEYASLPGPENSADSIDSAAARMEEAIRKITGAVRVDITKQKNEELIGGYRLRMGDELIDASIRSQLRKLESCLAAGAFGPGSGGY